VVVGGVVPFWPLAGGAARLGVGVVSLVEVPPDGVGVGEGFGVPFVFGAGAAAPGPEYISTPGSAASDSGASEQPARAASGKSVRRAAFVANLRFTAAV